MAMSGPPPRDDLATACDFSADIGLSAYFVCDSLGHTSSMFSLVGLRTQTQKNAALLNATDLNASPGTEGSL